MRRLISRPLLLLALTFASCAGRLDPMDFLVPSPEVDPGAPPLRSVRTARHPQTGELAARWGLLVYPDGRVVRDGREERFHQDGTRASVRHFAAGQPVGEWRQWYADGTPRSTYEFVAGEPTQMTFFHPGGGVSARGMAVDGVREGEWVFWHSSGGLHQSGLYAQGVREGVWTLRWPDGGLRSRGYFSADERVGEWRHWSERPYTAESDWRPPAPVSSGR